MAPLIKPRTKKYKSLISPARDKNEPIYNWHAFKHSYSKQLVEELIQEFKLPKGSWVLDPFSGGGTTLLACKELGINTQGFDILPFSVFLSNVKTRTYKPEELRKQLASFAAAPKTRAKKGESLPDINIVNLAFNTGVKNELLTIRRQIELIRNSIIKDFYMLGLLSILESVSNASKAGGFLRITNKKIAAKDVRPAFLDRVTRMITDVEIFNQRHKPQAVKSSTALGDARNFPISRKFDAIITSPPYPNRHDYTRIYALELILNFVQDNDELKKIRYDTLRSHVEAKKRFEIVGYKKPAIVDKLVDQVKKRGTNNSKVPEMIEGYFEDMFLCLLQMRKSLKKNGKIALVVSNVRFAGVNVPVDKILAEVGEQSGLVARDILVARYRGNSAQQMDTYKKRPSRESIVVWEKV
jgi:DNA modification methylase